MSGPPNTQPSASLDSRNNHHFHSSHYISLATQSVLTESGPALARVAIIDYRGAVLLDLLCIPKDEVINYHTETTGFQPEHFTLSDIVAEFKDVRRSAAMFLADRLIIGYETWKSLNLLQLSHPAIMTRDLATYMPLRPNPESSDTLASLVQKYLRREIRGGLINPVEDARAAMDLFRCCEEKWESSIAGNFWPSFLPPNTFSQCYT